MQWLSKVLVPFVMMGLLGFGGYSFAGYLTITGSSILQTKKISKDAFQLKGTYQIKNQGDETAFKVFPSFQVGEWKWAGAPQSIKAGGSFDWQLDEKIPTADLGCPNKSDCIASFLPVVGSFPLRIRHHYSDVNGYEFSAADLQKIQLGDLPKAKLAALRVPSLQMTMTVKGNGQKFSGKVKIRNLSDANRKMFISFFTTREIRILTQPQVFEVGPNAIENFPFEVENYSGLLGSSYAFFVSTEWDEGGLRNAASGHSTLAIKKRSYGNYMIIAAIGAFLALSALLYFGVFKRSLAPT